MGGRGGRQRRLALQLLVGAAGAAALAVCAQRTETDTHMTPPPPPPPPPPCPGMWHPCTSNCEGGPGCADHIDSVYGLTCAEAAEYGCVSDLWRFSCAAGAADCIDADIPHYTYVVELCPRTCGECDRTYGEYHVNEDGLLTDIWDEIAPVPSCAPEPLDCREEPKDADNNHCEVPDVCEAADCTEPFTKLKDSPDECQGGACTAPDPSPLRSTLRSQALWRRRLPRR